MRTRANPLWRWWIEGRVRDWYSDWIGMPLAKWLDAHHPDWCWAWICTAVGCGWFFENWLKKAKKIGECRAECERNGSCWCGKLRDEERERIWRETRKAQSQLL